ncbi:hypothetical protein TWF694_002599 [Orbilia ellipsospora]|uniref:Uncharacterized protein n=1 Tax=Orbilia ellipsospora TaxID=2528407 RepID=A0AAV9X2H5_9PEZI
MVLLTLLPLLIALTLTTAEIESHINLKIYFTDNTITALSIDPKAEPYCRGIDFPLRKPQSFSAPKIGAIIAESHIASTEQINGIDFSVYVGEDALSCDDYEKPPYDIFLPYYAPGWNAKKVEDIESGGSGGGGGGGIGVDGRGMFGNLNFPSFADSDSSSSSDSSDEEEHKTNRGEKEANSAISYMSPIRPVSFAEDGDDSGLFPGQKTKMPVLQAPGLTSMLDSIFESREIPSLPGLGLAPRLQRQYAVDGRSASELQSPPSTGFLDNMRNMLQLRRPGTLFPGNNPIKTESISEEDLDIMDRATIKAENEEEEQVFHSFEEEKEPYDSSRIKKRYAPTLTKSTVSLTKRFQKRALEGSPWSSAYPEPLSNPDPPANHILRPAPMTTKQELYPDSQEPFLFFSDPTSFILYAKISPKGAAINPVPLYEEQGSGSMVIENDPYDVFTDEDLNNIVDSLERGSRTT